MNYLALFSGTVKELSHSTQNNSMEACFVVQLFMNEAVYVGEWRNKKANGIGKLIMNKDFSIEGLFVENFIKKGRIRYPSGATFEGEFDGTEKQDFKKGTFRFKNKCVLEGNWCDGKFTKGVLSTPILVGGKSKFEIDMNNKKRNLSEVNFRYMNILFINFRYTETCRIKF